MKAKQPPFPVTADTNPNDVCPACRAYALWTASDGERACSDPACAWRSGDPVAATLRAFKTAYGLVDHEPVAVIGSRYPKKGPAS